VGSRIIFVGWEPFCDLIRHTNSPAQTMKGEAGENFPSDSEGATGWAIETVRHPQARFAFLGGILVTRRSGWLRRQRIHKA